MTIGIDTPMALPENTHLLVLRHSWVNRDMPQLVAQDQIIHVVAFAFLHGSSGDEGEWSHGDLTFVTDRGLVKPHDDTIEVAVRVESKAVRGDSNRESGHGWVYLGMYYDSLGSLKLDMANRAQGI